MSGVHPIKNTDQKYLCTNCGSNSVSIVREGPDPRLKCNACQFMFSGSDSKAAADAGAIPDKAPELQDQRPPVSPEANPRELKSRRIQVPLPKEDRNDIYVAASRIPRKIDYVIVAKDRKKTEFLQEKDLKKTILRWESGNQNYELFELQPKKSSVKIDVE